MTGSTTRRLGRWAALAVWAVIIVDIAALVAVAVGVLPEPPDSPTGGPLIFLLLTVAFGVVGARVVIAQPGNRLGWVMWLQASLIALSGPGASYALLSLAAHGGTLPLTAVAAWASGIALVPCITLTVLVVPMIFPDGNLPSRRWRPAAVVAVAAIVLVTVGSGVFQPGPLIGFPELENPFGVTAGRTIGEACAPLGALLTFVGLPLGVAAVVTRYRRGTPTERHQVKWFGAGVAVPALLLATALALETVTPLWTLSVAALGLVPASIGIAILRYRLYEIDRIISRTIGWALVTGILGVGLVAGVVALQTVLAPVTSDNTIAVAGSTLVALAFVQPLRRRVQRSVDRRFDRARYDAQGTSDRFAVRLRNEVDLPTLRTALVTTAHEAVRPAGVAVWLSTRGKR